MSNHVYLYNKVLGIRIASERASHPQNIPSRDVSWQRQQSTTDTYTHTGLAIRDKYAIYSPRICKNTFRCSNLMFKLIY